jgi:hypothetical protein
MIDFSIIDLGIDQGLHLVAFPLTELLTILLPEALSRISELDFDPLANSPG